MKLAPGEAGPADPPAGRATGRAARVVRRGARSPAVDHLAQALPPWLVARAVVLMVIVFNDWLAGKASGLHLASPRFAQLSLWDAGWYEGIAIHLYRVAVPEATRFFPLYPLMGHVLILGGFPPRLAMLGLANAFALVVGAQLHALVLHETGDAVLARRAAWLIALVPPAYVMVMAYSEPVALCAVIGGMDALRRRRWGWACAFGLAAGLARPTGLLLALPALVEGLRGVGRAGWGERLARAAAVIAAPAGTAVYLAWIGLQFGRPLLPFTTQTEQSLRGGIIDPFLRIGGAFVHVFQGQEGVRLLYLTIVILAVLAVICFFQWPVSYGLFAAAALLEPLTGARVLGAARYGLDAFPLVLVVARLARRPAAGAAAVVVGGVLMAMLFFLTAFLLYS